MKIQIKDIIDVDGSDVRKYEAMIDGCHIIVKTSEAWGGHITEERFKELALKAYKDYLEEL